MGSLASPVLVLSSGQLRAIVSHCFDGLPDEACGLLAGPIEGGGEPTGAVDAVYPCTNADASARTYTVDSRDLLDAMRDAESKNRELVGVWHSHTHTDPYPSDTDVRQAFEPGWIYVIVSLKHAESSLRAYRIVGGDVREVAVEVTD